MPTRVDFTEHAVIFTTALPADHVHLALADGTRVDAAHTGDTTTLVSGTYYFTVPADISAATLVVDAFTGPGIEFPVASGRDATIALPAFTIALKLPQPPAPPAATTPATALTLTHANPAASPATAAAGATRGRGSGQAPLGIVLALLAGAAAVTWATLRRRRDACHPAVTAGPANPWATAPAKPTPAPAAPTRAGPAAPPLAAPPEPPMSPGPVPPPASTQPATPAPSTTLAQLTPPGQPPPVTDDDALVSVGLLGPREITGPGLAKLRPRELEVFVFLAVNRDRAVTNDDIRAALAGASDDESNANTVRTWLSRIRSAVGTDVLPEADNGRYRLTGVDTDIDRLHHLLAQAAAADPAAARAPLKDAVGLVRGRPFETLDYRWTHLLVANLETAIADAAARLADLAAQADDRRLGRPARPRRHRPTRRPPPPASSPRRRRPRPTPPGVA